MSLHARTVTANSGNLPPTEVGSVHHFHQAWWDGLLLTTLLVWTFLGLCCPLIDTDFWWHLKTGEWILSHGTVPYVDLYTYMDADKPWIDLHWGFQVLITLLHRAGGIPLVTLAKAFTITAAVAIAWSATPLPLPTWKKALLWILPIICIVGRGNERPEMLSQLFLATWIWIVRRSEQQPRLIWWLPLVQLIWVNCHGLFVLGPVVGCCFAIDAGLRHFMRGRFDLDRRTSGPRLRSIGIVAGMVALACFINPYFVQGALFPLTLFRKFRDEKEFYSQNIGEFRPPIDFFAQHGFSSIYLVSELFLFLLAAGSLIWLLVFYQRWSPLRLLLLAGFSYLAWQATRNTNIFALVAGWVATENFADIEAVDADIAMSHNPRANLRRTYCVAGLICALCLMVVTGYWNQIGDKNRPFGLGEAPNEFIHDAAKFAAQDGFPKRAYVAHLGQAEVYVYHNGPERKVFMDARLEVCTEQTFRLFNDAGKAMATGSARWLSRYAEDDLPVVILDSRFSRPSINGLLQTPSWRLVFADRTAAVFLPVGLADKLNLPPANPQPLIYPDGPPKQKS